jgi:hypothetical protein
VTRTRTFRKLVVTGAVAALALVHLFPAKKHLAELTAHPSFGEAWKGLGALVAVVMYLLPMRVQAEGLGRMWARHRGLLAALGWGLAVAHLVPAADHLPRFVESASWADGWRGLGAAAAVAWFVAPLPVQGTVLLWVRRGFEPARASTRGPRLAVLASGLLIGCASGAIASRRAQRIRPIEVHVPRAAGAIDIDGELADPAWRGPVARSGAFTANGIEARPYSDARFARTGRELLVALYAADEDLRSASDIFRVALRTADGEHVLEVSPAGLVARRASDVARVRAGHEVDGTVDDASDEDEEWVVELAVPFDALGVTGRPGERVGISIERCDVLRPRPGDAGGVRCSDWGVTRPVDLVL